MTWMTPHSANAQTVHEDADAIAAGWVARMDRSALNASERADLARWLAIDRSHQGALARAQVVWQATERLSSLRSPQFPPPSDTTTTHAVRGAFSRRKILASAAATVAAGLLPSTSREMETFHTIRDGPPRNFVVAGGWVRLDCYSTLQTSHLQSRLLGGRCLFTGKHKARIAADILTVWLDGRLELSCGQYMTEVLLLSGSAMVRSTLHCRMRQLRPGDHLIVADGEKEAVEHFSPEKILHETSWERGFIELQGETLSQAATLFNKYNARKIYVHGQAKGQVLLGSFSLHEPAAFVAAAHAALRVKTVMESTRMDIF